MDALLIGKNRTAAAKALVDSGATGNLINWKFAARHQMKPHKLEKPIPLHNADDSQSEVKSYVIVTMELQDKQGITHREKIEMYAANIGQQDIILGTDWLIKHNPEINWETYEIKFSRCPEECRPDQPLKLKTKPTHQGKGNRTRKLKINREELPSKLWAEEEDSEGQLGKWTYQGLKAARVFFPEIESLYARISGLKQDESPRYSNMSQKLAQEAAKNQKKKDLKELVPERYHEFLDIFDTKKADRFPQSRPWDHPVDLKPGFEPKDCKIYPIAPKEQNTLDDWIKDNLAKGYIRASSSPQASPFFFVGKKDGDLRPCQDYKYLNSWTIKNAYPIPLISEIIDKLKTAKIFTKCDIRKGYNNVRIKDGDQWKAAFKTNKGLFEPMVMFFGLCNSPATFQSMMNGLFRNLIDEGVVIVYLDDILIFTETLEEHRIIVKKVLQILKDNDLYLKPEKCEFERHRIEYLGLIITHGHTEMDPVKVAGIMDWPRPKKVKEVQAFLGFCNFYRRFIRDFSHIAKPLFELTKKDHQWNWSNECEVTFLELKKQFTSAPMLTMPDTRKPMRLECDASDFATGAVLTQKEDDDKFHPVAYLSKSLTEPERNYDIYDKELLAIIKALDAWRHYLEGAENTIEIFTDHKNLEYFKKAQKLSRRQARWAQFLSRFDFTLIHKPGKTNKVDGLSRRIDHKEGVENDNLDRILLPDSLFSRRISTVTDLFKADIIGRGSTEENKAPHTKSIREMTVRTIQTTVEIQGDLELKDKIKKSQVLDFSVAQALEIIKENGPRSMSKGLQEWNLEDGLILFRGKVYIPRDEELRREIVKLHHDPPTRGHPGRYQTQELMSRNYWWPGMGQFIKEYVEGCAICQETKINTHPTKEPIHPTEIPTRPFQIITSDLIVGLPESDGYTALVMITDRHTKKITVEPCKDEIDADQLAEILVRRIFSQYGLAEKLISDRGPQYSSKVMRAVLSTLGIRSALSTAYHPQTDGASERANQSIEQYLRAYANRIQNNWAKLIPMAELAYNSHEHSATKKAPFELLLGYLPTWPSEINPDPKIPTAEQRLLNMQLARKEATAALEIAEESMRTQQDKYGTKGPDFQEGNQVWLEGKNLKTQYPSAKLAPKRYGPFKVTKEIGLGSYHLELPKHMKIHPVFHASLLTPYKETEAHGPNFRRPPPDIIEHKEEFEVQEICGVRQFGKQKRWQYLIKWKGYPDSENTWEPLGNLTRSHDLINEWHEANPKKPKPSKLTAAISRFPTAAIAQLERSFAQLAQQKLGGQGKL